MKKEDGKHKIRIVGHFSNVEVGVRSIFILFYFPGEYGAGTCRMVSLAHFLPLQTLPHVPGWLEICSGEVLCMATLVC